MSIISDQLIQKAKPLSTIENGFTDSIIRYNYLLLNRNIGTIISSNDTPPCWNVLR